MPEQIEALVHPYSRTQDWYQTYYRESLAQYCATEGLAYAERGADRTGVLRLLGRVRNSHRLQSPSAARHIDRVASWLGAREWSKPPVGWYRYSINGVETRFCIDSADPGEIAEHAALDWCDVYFKTNFWPELRYPTKVVPLANLNPGILRRQEELQHLRNQHMDLDLFAFFRVWGRIEHNLQLFEALAALRCRKRLLAYLISSDWEPEAARLERVGVDWCRRPMSQLALWQTTARSNLSLIRHGVADCIPWRMSDMLAMGGCSVMDYSARTQWHVPLTENVHYLSLGFSPTEAITEDSVARCLGRVDQWLSRPELLKDIRAASADYFDVHLRPTALGQYIVNVCRATLAGRSSAA